LRKQLKNGALNITGSNISSLTDDNNPGTVYDSNSDDESLNTKLTSQCSNNSDFFVPMIILALILMAEEIYFYQTM
jgi:hypothetical protein